MESLGDRALHFADNVGSNYLEEARGELTGQSGRKWALILAAFVIGAAVAFVAIAMRASRHVETDGGTDADTAAAAPVLAASDSVTGALQGRDT